MTTARRWNHTITPRGYHTVRRPRSPALTTSSTEAEGQGADGVDSPQVPKPEGQDTNQVWQAGG